jgi:Di-haem oxidoreductase, putative peroxidase
MLTSVASAVVGLIVVTGSALAQTTDTAPAAVDPGVRGGAAGAGGPLPGLTATNPDGSPGGELAFFEHGKEDFAEEEGVGDGLGPRFNLNPRVAKATEGGVHNVVPSFIRANGPIREARFVKKPDGTPDGGVHALFVISGRVDDTGNATGCNAVQENFEAQVAAKNIIFRIPTPVFGAGLIEMIKDTTLVNNLATNPNLKSAAGISGRLNRNGNDGTVSRFGWKAQNQSLLLFSGEAYNVEMGITNEIFQSERDENPTCQFATVPNDTQLFDTTAGFPDLIQAVENFANFQRFLDQPTPSTTTPGGATSITRGRQVFNAIGCGLCHTPSLTTSNVATVAALKNKTANLFSDVALHAMGTGLADGVAQGGAAGDEFRTSPLWGVGKRIFFLHDGRTRDIQQAIREHASPGSEANTVVGIFNLLPNADKQNVLNFLRSL